MRILVILVLSLFSVASFARSSEDRLDIGGYYGLGSVSPSDINGIASSLSTTPSLNSLNTNTIIGAQLGYMLSRRWQLLLSYEWQDAKNPVDITSPGNVSGAGFELVQDEAWAGLNYMFYESGNVYLFVGAQAGYPTYSHVKETYTTDVDYTAASTLAGRAQVGAGVMFGRHFSLFIEGGYQYMVSGNITDPSGNILQNTSGANAKADLSGARGEAGVNIYF